MSQWVKKKVSTGLGFFVLNRAHASEHASDKELLKLSSGVGSPAIQELDGGFFEKFGTLLREPSPSAEAEPSEGASGAAAEGADGDEGLSSAAEGGDEPSGAGAAPVRTSTGRMDVSDSEGDVDEAQRDLVSSAVGLNVEELYTEVLHQIVHNVGCDVVTKGEQEEVCALLRDAFKMDPDKHQFLLEQAQSREAPKLVLNVEIMEGKDLKPKDANGLSDPFCTLYMNSSTTHRYNTSVKQQTLTPTWQEHFSLPVKNPAEDVLTVEVWDFDPAETVREKVGKLGDVKGVRGLRKLIKEIAQTASTGKHDNELVGSATVALSCIPSAGQTMWCNLERPGKMRRQGMLRLHCSFSAEKNQLVAATEHRNLIRLLLLHHLDSQKAAAYRWSGEWDPRAETILRQHAVQSGLSTNQQNLAKWAEYVTVHVDHPLSFIVFAELVAQLKGPLVAGQLPADEEKLFWESARRLLPSCMNSIRRLRKLASCDTGTITQLAAILSTLAQLSSLTPPPETDLFPSSVYGWLSAPTEGPNCDIRDVLEDAVLRSGEDWLAYVLSNHSPDDSSDKAQLSYLIQIVQLVRSDLQKAIEFHAKLFQTTVRIRYASALYRVYEAKVSEMVKPVVEEICNKLRPLRFDENEALSNGTTDGRSDELLSTGTTLFELYLALQRLSTLGEELCPTDRTSLAISSYHQWFYRGVAQWLDMALYKAMQRIEKAVELDLLVPVDASVKYSSSAVDTLSIFYQIKIFWQQLAWPDVEGCYTFVAKIIDDICRCCVFYADKMSKKVEGLGDVSNGTVHEKKFEVTQEWCLAINNIEHVRQSIEPFVSKLGMDNIVASLADFRSPAAAEHCRETLRQIVDNAVDTVHTETGTLLDALVEKMAPAVRRFMREGAELINQDCNSVDRLMQYLDRNLIILHENLNTENFERILSAMWSKVASSLLELVETSLEKRRPPSFFAKLQETVNVLIGFFKQEHELVDDDKLNDEACVKDAGTGREALRCVRRLLKLHALETHQLAHQFHLRRLAEQKRLTEGGQTPALGQLTVRAQLVFNTLHVEIMNARNLMPSDSNGSCDPYVKVHLLPEDVFATVNKPKTKTQKKCQFPLFDELFTIPLTPEQRSCQDAMLLFVVKDQDFIGTNEFLGETYLFLAEVPETDESVSISSLPQVHLPLHKPGPEHLESDVMRALEHRQGDKLAREFVKRQKTKLSEVKQNGHKSQ